MVGIVLSFKIYHTLTPELLETSSDSDVISSYRYQQPCLPREKSIHHLVMWIQSNELQSGKSHCPSAPDASPHLSMVNVDSPYTKKHLSQLLQASRTPTQYSVHGFMSEADRRVRATGTFAYSSILQSLQAQITVRGDFSLYHPSLTFGAISPIFK